MWHECTHLVRAAAIAASVGLAACGGGGGGGGTAPPGAGGTPSLLDLTCNTTGWRASDFGNNHDDGVRAVVVQPDGKILTGGYRRFVDIPAGADDDDFVLRRFNPDCTLDTTFAIIGSNHFGGTSNDQIHALALQADGKIVAAGRTQWNGTTTESTYNFALARYTSNGELDATFGSNGRVVTSVSACSLACGDDEAHAVAIQSDGKIVVAGYYIDVSTPGVWHMAVARYNTNGALDTTFGSGGIARTTIADGDTARAIAIQSDGKIVVAGESAPIGGYADFALVRYLSNGALDNDFNCTVFFGTCVAGTGGKVVTAMDTGQDVARALVIQPADGKIVVAGQSASASDLNARFALARYLINGALDTGFGTGGKVITPVGDAASWANALALQTDGKLVAAGSATNSGDRNFALARYSPDGGLDTGFGSGGIVTTDFAVDDRAFAVALQADGKIVAAGCTNCQTGVSSGAEDSVIARYLFVP